MKAQAGPVNRQGSCVRSGGSLKTQLGLSEAKTEVRARAGGSGLLAGQSAAAVGGGRTGTQGTAGREEGEVTIWLTPPPPPPPPPPSPVYISSERQPKRLPSKFSLYLANLALLAFLHSKKKNFKIKYYY